jgi:FKBP-type peptidyl-prolyl cis-trans isomerase
MAATNLMAAQNQASGVLADYRKEMNAKAERARLELARRNREQGKAFCETNAYREGVTTLPSGLQFRVLKSGEGPLVDPKMIIKTVWRGTLIDGTEFQDTRKQLLGSEFDFAKQQVRAGLKEALPLMHVGDRWEIVLPSDIAYGNAGYLNGIPPGATLIYDLEVVSLEPPLEDLITGGSSVSPDANSGAAPDTTKLK